MKLLPRPFHTPKCPGNSPKRQTIAMVCWRSRTIWSGIRNQNERAVLESRCWPVGDGGQGGVVGTVGRGPSVGTRAVRTANTHNMAASGSAKVWEKT